MSTSIPWRKIQWKPSPHPILRQFLLLHNLAPPSNIADPPRLNLNHPILSRLESCLNLAQFDQIQAHIITTGMFQDVFAASRLLKFSAFSLDPPDIRLANLIFSRIQCPDAYSYNLMIKAWSMGSNPLESLRFYCSMLGQGIRPNEYTLCFLLGCCSHGLAFWQGRQVHGHLHKLGLGNGVFACTSLIHMYGECEGLDDAIQVFEEMPHRTAVSWASMIDAYITCGHAIEGLKLFAKMRKEGFNPTNATLVAILCACAKAGDLVLGRVMHSYLEVSGLELNVTLGTSLVYMYSKCGAIETAMAIFSTMPTRNVASWNCMIHGLAMNGNGAAAVNMFKEIPKLIVQPNEVTFLSVLHGCSHSGLVEDGFKCFSMMKEDYGISPNLKHYGCMVDLYGRAGKIMEAMRLVKAMPMEPDAVIWGILFTASKVHGHAMVGELIGVQLIKRLPNDTCGYLLLSDMFAMSSLWDDVLGVRKMMADMNIKKSPGCSSISK